jgi:hypothetical protein
VESQVLTRGEPRPVHITLIATCRVLVPFYNSVLVARRITPGLSPGYENPLGPAIHWQVCYLGWPAFRLFSASHIRVLATILGPMGHMARVDRARGARGPLTLRLAGTPER